MSYTYRKRIKLSKSYGINKSVEYISNKEKTTLKHNDIRNAINYAMNPSKTVSEDKQYCFCQNCEIDTANEEIENVLREHDAYEIGETALFHTVISFSYTDPITPEKMVEYGQEFLQKFCPDFVSIGYCHIHETAAGTGSQPHIHILTSAVSRSGEKMNNNFFGERGLLQLRKTCDELSKKYGCEVIPNGQTTLFGKGKPYYVRNFNYSQSEQIRNAIDLLKPLCSSLNDLLELLELEYSAGVERSKQDISISLPGFERSKRLSSLGEGYGLKDLNTYFYRKRQGYLSEKDLELFKQVRDDEAVGQESRLVLDKLSAIYAAVEARLENKRMTPNEYKELKVQNAILEILEEKKVLEELEVKDHKDLVAKKFQADRDLIRLKKEYEQQKNELSNILELKHTLRNYLKLYPKYKEYKKGAIEKDADIELFELISNNIEESYGIGSELEDVREAYTNIDERVCDNHRKLAEISKKEYLVKKLRRMEIDNPDYPIIGLKSINFTEKNVIAETEDSITFTLPYLKDLAIEVPLSSMTSKFGRYTYHIIDDEVITLKTSEGEYVSDVPAEDVFEEIEKKKKEIEHKHTEDQAVSMQGDFLTLPITMVDAENSDYSNCLIRLPFSNQLMSIPAERLFSQDSKKVIIDLSGNGSLEMFKANGEIAKPRYVKYLRQDMEQKIAQEKQKANDRNHEPDKDEDKDKNNSIPKTI